MMEKRGESVGALLSKKGSNNMSSSSISVEDYLCILPVPRDRRDGSKCGQGTNHVGDQMP